MSDMSDKPYEHEEPERFERGHSVWARGLFMLIFVFFFAIAETILAVLALVQFLFMVFTKEKNVFLVAFGRDLARWMQDVARFQTGSSEDKPFPWRAWGE